MADEPDSLILRALSDMRTRSDAQHAELRERLDSIDTRLQALELQVTGLHSTNAEFRKRFEGIENRLDRIERRLEIVDA